MTQFTYWFGATLGFGLACIVLLIVGIIVCLIIAKVVGDGGRSIRNRSTDDTL